MTDAPITLLQQFGLLSLRGMREITGFREFHAFLHNSIGKAMLIATKKERNLPPGERPPPMPDDPMVELAMRDTFLTLAMMLEDARAEGVIDAGENGTFEQVRTATIAAFEKHLNKHIPPPEVMDAVMKVVEAAQAEHEKHCPNCKAAKEKAEASACDAAKKELDAARKRTTH